MLLCIFRIIPNFFFVDDGALQTEAQPGELQTSNERPMKLKLEC